MIESFLKYLQYEKRCSPHTLTSYETDLTQFNAFLQTSGEFKELEGADFAVIRSWIVSMVDGGISARSVNRKIATLRAYYKYLLKKGTLSVDPTQKVKSLKTGKPLPPFVEESRLNHILDTFDFPDNFSGVRDRLVMELLYGTGMRLSEMTGLKQSEVSLPERTIKVTGKRNKQRIVPISRSLADLISRYQDSRKTLTCDQPWLIVTDEGKQAYPMMVYRLVRKYLDLATTHERRSPHVLRHTYATHLLNRGADLNAVKDLLGHSSLAATQVYTHHSISKLKEIYEKAHPKG
jgi:integrase/recombinase XerC